MDNNNFIISNTIAVLTADITKCERSYEIRENQLSCYMFWSKSSLMWSKFHNVSMFQMKNLDEGYASSHTMVLIKYRQILLN